MSDLIWALAFQNTQIILLGYMKDINYRILY